MSGNRKAIHAAAVGVWCLLRGVAVGAQFTHATLGYSLSYPDTWHAVVSPAPGPLDLMSFPEYRHGGVIPPGGAAINVQVLGPDQTNETAVGKLHRPPDAVRSKQVVHGYEVERLEWDDDIDPSHHYKEIAAAAHIAGTQFLFILNFDRNAARAEEWERVLAEVIGSVSVGKAAGR